MNIDRIFFYKQDIFKQKACLLYRGLGIKAWLILEISLKKRSSTNLYFLKSQVHLFFSDSLLIHEHLSASHLHSDSGPCIGETAQPEEQAGE